MRNGAGETTMLDEMRGFARTTADGAGAGVGAEALERDGTETTSGGGETRYSSAYLPACKGCRKSSSLGRSQLLCYQAGTPQAAPVACMMHVYPYTGKALEKSVQQQVDIISDGAAAISAV